MRLMEPLEVPILYDTDISKINDSINKFNEDDFDYQNATFYSVDNIQPSDESENLTMIYSGGFSFYVKMPYWELKSIVDKLMT